MMAMKNGDTKNAVSSPSVALITSNYHHFSSPLFIALFVPWGRGVYNRFFPWTKAPAPRIDA